MTKLKINLKELVNFYDFDHGAGIHSNAIKTLAGEELGFALMSHYFQGRGQKAIRLAGPCTTRSRPGNQLDGWFEVQRGSHLDHYQVEVKSWSFHGYGARVPPLAWNCKSSELRKFQVESWGRYWKDGAFVAEGLKKVLQKMEAPPRHSQIRNVKPLACLWSPLHPQGKLEPLFSVKTAAATFPLVWVFSMSTYARSLLTAGRKTISVEMEKTSVRMDHLNRIFF
jgi:hypothetical protein